MRRFLEPWWYMSNPFAYDANGRARIVLPPVPQRTWNVLVGMFGIGASTRPAALMSNIVRSIIINENEHIIGNGCPLGLIATNGRLSGTPAATAFAPPNGVFPTYHGFGYFPGNAFELYDGLRVCGIPCEAQSTVTVIVENQGDAASELEQIGFAAVEIPADRAAENYQELEALWKRVERGLGGASFATHMVDIPEGGVANFDDATVLTTWHNYELRRTDLRGVYLRNNPLAPGEFAPDENGYNQTTINTRSDRCRDVGVGFAPAPCVTGYAGLRNSPQFPMDFRSNGEDRQIMTVNAPNLSGIDSDRVWFCGVMQGIEERQYWGRVSGQAY